MQNPVNVRLGKRPNNYSERAHKKKVRQVANQLARESGGFRSELARSYLQIEPEQEGVES